MLHHLRVAGDIGNLGRHIALALALSCIGLESHSMVAQWNYNMMVNCWRIIRSVFT